MKYVFTCFAVLGAFALSSASAGIIYIEFHGTTTDATTASFTALGQDVNDGILGYNLMADVGSNPQQALWASDATSGNTRYHRFRNDLRSGQGDFEIQGGSSLTPTGGTGGDRWNTTWTDVQTGNSSFLRYSDDTSWPADGNASDVGTLDFGFVEGLNWGLYATPDSAGYVGAVDGGGIASVFAVGIVFEDVDQDGNIDTGDNLWLRYVLGADSLAEIDTTAELDLAVGIPEPATLVLLGLGGLVLLRRRRS